jgi:hypothetical protein
MQSELQSTLFPALPVMAALPTSSFHCTVKQIFNSPIKVEPQSGDMAIGRVQAKHVF